jgi:hypothetical protein
MPGGVQGDPSHFARYIRDSGYSAMAPLWCLCALTLGSSGLIWHAGSGATFMLALPVSRTRIALTRVAIAAGELYVLALVPSLTVAAATALAGGQYAWTDALAASLCLFAAGTVFFAIPFFLSSVFQSFLVAFVTMLGTALLITLAREGSPDLARFTLAPLLTARDYFNGTPIPWMGFVDTLAISAVLIALAIRNIARRDF